MSNTSLLLFFSILPIVIILVFIYNMDKSKEPLVLLLSFFILGIFSCFGVVAISDFLSNYLAFMAKSVDDLNYLDTILYAFIGVALVEELCKWVVVFFIGYFNKEFDETYDIIVYSVFIGLGFAFFENIIYIFNAGDLETVVSRGLLAVPAHACYAISMGHYLSLAKQEHVKGRRLNELGCILISIIIPFLLHGIYDYCLMSNLLILLKVFIVFIIALDVYSIQKIRRGATENIKLKRERFCPNCGLSSKDNVCPNCGTKIE